MMKKSTWFKTAILVSCSGLLVTACHQMPEKKEVQTPESTADLSCDSVPLALGHELQIELESNPSTGYSWKLVSEPKNLVLVSDTYQAEQSDTPTLIGAGGIQTFTLEATSRGVDTLDFEYKRSWEKDVPPAQVRSCTVSVN